MNENLLPVIVGAAVVLLVWGIGQILSITLRGEKRKLHQRLHGEGAIETQSPLFRPIAIQMEGTGFAGVLMRWRLFQRLHCRLLQAYPETPPGRFLIITGAFVVVLFALAGLFSRSLVVGLVAGAIGGYIPFFFLAAKRSRRQRALAGQLPESLDFLSRILRAGHSLSTGLQMLGEELPHPLAGEFRRCYDQHSLGLSLEESLKEMAIRVESTDFAFFVTAVLIQRQTGGDLSEVLKNISGMIRQRIHLQQHVKAKTAEGRFSGYMLVAFPAVMFVLASMLSPDYSRVLLHTTSGHYLLGTAFGLQVLGLLAIRKITTIRV